MFGVLNAFGNAVLETKSELTGNLNKVEETIYSDFRLGSFFLLTMRGLISVSYAFLSHIYLLRERKDHK